MEDFLFHRRGGAAASAPPPGKVAAGRRGKPRARYGDMFSGPQGYASSATPSSFFPARPENYREIFGAAAACSLPVLDLPPPGDGYKFRPCSSRDYLDIFGGSCQFAPYYEDLFASNAVGPPPPPSGLGDASASANTSNSRGSNSMDAKQEVSVPGVVVQGSSRDQIGFSLNGVAHHLNVAARQSNRSDHVSGSSKNDSINGTIHKNQVHTVSGYAFVVDKPDSQVEVDIIFESNCGKGTSEGQHLRKSLPSTSSCTDLKYSVNDMKADQRFSLLEFPESMSTSSKNQSTLTSSNGLSAKVSIDYNLPEKFIERKTEDDCHNKTVPTVISATSGNELTAKCTASEDVPANCKHHSSCSSNGCSTPSGAKSFPDHLANEIGIDAANIGNSEAIHVKKSMSISSSCTSLQSSEKDNIAEQKEPNPKPTCPTNAPLNEGQHSHSSSTHSISSLDRPCSDRLFVTVSDINLRTQPSRGPPPARPPPARPPSKSGISERSLRRTLTDYQNHDVPSGNVYKSHSFKQAVRDDSPSAFDLEVDASSAAAASVAAIKEAMELAEAKLKSAKVSMERKKDNFQSRRKFSFNDEIRSINKDDGEAIQKNQRMGEEVVVQLAAEKNDATGNVYATEKVATAFSTSKLTADSKERERNCGSSEESLQAMHWGEAGLSDLSHKMVDKVGEWKVEEQFYELRQSGKDFNKIPENSLNKGSEKRSHAITGIVGELNVSEAKKNEELSAVSKVTEWEGDSNKMPDLITTSEEQTKDSQNHAQDSYVNGECPVEVKETIKGHQLEKKPRQDQELLETKPETKWRTSEEAFICELSEKNPGVHNDAFKCKSVDEHQSHVKAERISDENCGHKETEKEINVTDKSSHECEKDHKAWGKLSELDENKTEANVNQVNVSAKVAHSKTASKSCENVNLKLSFKADRYDSLHAGEEIDSTGTRQLSKLVKRKLSNITSQTFECAGNASEPKAASEAYDCIGNVGSVNLIQASNGCSCKTNDLKEGQKFPVKTGKELQWEVAKHNTSSKAGVVDGFDDAITAIRVDDEKKMDETIKEVPIVANSNKELESAQAVWKKTGNEKKEDAQQTVGEEGNIRKEAQGSSENHITGWSVENDFESDKTGEDINEGKMESEQARNLEEVKGWETRKSEENGRERIKLEEERERKHIELEEERERDKLLEEAKNGGKRKVEEEKVRERRKLEEKEKERRMLEEERERERKLQKEEEWKRKKLEEKKREKKRKLEEEERERKKLEEDERERRKLEEAGRESKLEAEKRKLQVERESKKLEEELERKKNLEEEKERTKIEETERKKKIQEEEDRERSQLEEKERERRKQEEEREKQRSEEAEREQKKLEETERERRRIDEEENLRERRKIEEERMWEKKLEEEKERERRKIEEEKERERIKLEEEREREREREKDRQAVERATRETHERAFVEARERAERAAVERATAEARQRAMAEARERAEKASAESLEKSMAEKASREARLRAERAAVERATAEARERAAEKAIAEKAAQDARERAEKLATTSRDGIKQNAGSFTNENFGESEGESAIRCKARMERHQRTVERAAKALAEKNLRDIIAQREQAERNRLAETLDADVKRWSSGKEGNLRALLSTLQYILGPESGWQPIPLTEVVTAPAVKKAYRKATLCVHPDKLQQRGASIQQKYICEKVFDLLKEAWNKFNSEVQ